MKYLKTYFLLILFISIIKSDSLLDDFYKKAFGGATSSKDELFLPLIVNGKEKAEIFVLIKDKKIFLQKNDMEYIISFIKVNYHKEFKYTIEKDGFGAISQISKNGIVAKLDYKNVLLNINIPPKYRKLQKIIFNRFRKIDINESIFPQKYSGGMNLYLNYSGNGNQDKDFKFEPFKGSIEPFLNINSYVLDTRFRYDGKKYHRGNVKVTKDVVDMNLRVQVGDIYLPSHNLHSSQNVLGLKLEKIFNMSHENYNRNTYRINSYEFFLKFKSKVEVYINDRLNKTLNLEAGTNNIYDLSIPTGVSQIKLRIIEDSGKIEFIYFDDFNYNELYQKGITKYGLGVGVSYKDTDGKRDYNQTDKILSTYFDYGLFDSLTVKSGLQLKDKFSSVSMQTIYGTSYGIFDFNYLKSFNKYLNKNIDGSKYQLRYRVNIFNTNLSLTGEKTEKNFKSISNYQSAVKDTDVDGSLFRISLSRTLFKGVSTYSSFSKYSNINGKKREDFSIAFTKNFSSKLYVRLTFDYNKYLDEKEDTKRVYLTLNYNFGNYRSRYEHTRNYNKSNSANSYQNNLYLGHRTKGVYHYDNSIELRNKNDSDNLLLRSNVVDEKYRLNLNYNYNKFNVASRYNHNLNAQLSSGIFFAGNNWTIGKPTSSSFIIVENDKKLKKKPLGLKGYQKAYEKHYKSFVMDLGDYSHRKLNVEEKSLNLGVDILNPRQSFISKYRTGSVMNITVQSFYSAGGRLINKNTNEPIKLQIIKAVNRDTGKKEISFTNDNGDFSIADVSEGTYDVTIFRKTGKEKISRFSFKVKKDEEKSIILLGTIKI